MHLQVLLLGKLVIGCAFALAVAADAVSQPPAGRPGLPVAGAPRRPSPDTAKAVIHGTVLAGDTGSPLRSATVTLLLRDVVVRVVATDQDGRFSFDNLDAGRYVVVARRSGYLPWAHGQRDDGMPGRMIDVGPAARISAIDVRLPRNGAIVGRITDEFGAPLSAARVQAWRTREVGGRRRLVAAGVPRETDDLGQFRVFGLGPGDYYLTAALKGADEDATSDVGNANYAPTFYPGTLNSAEASQVSVGLGQDAVADFPLVPAAAFTVSGIAVSGSGGVPVGGHVELLPRRDLVMGALMPGQFTAAIQPGGAFTLRRVPPGTYTVVVVTTGSRLGTGLRLTEPESGTVFVGVDRRDVADVQVLTTPGTSFAGRFTVDGVRPAVSPQGVRVTAVPASPDEPESAVAGPSVPVRDDWTFELRGVHGRRLLDISNLPPGLAVRSTLADGQDVTTTGIMTALRQRVTVDVTLTSHLTEVTGVARDGTGRAARDYVVLCFSADRLRRADPLRRYQRLVRADQDGRFTVTGLPAGNYQIIALEDLPAGALDEPLFFDRMRERARPITLVDGTSRTLDLQLESY